MITDEDRQTATSAKRVVQRYFDHVTGMVQNAADDGNAFYELFAEDATWTFPGEFEFAGTKYGRESIFKDFFAPVKALFEADLEVGDLVIMGDGPEIAAEYLVNKTSHNGKRFNLRIVQVFVVEGDKIAAVREYADVDYLRRTCIDE